MTNNKQTLIRLGLFILFAFGLSFVPELICLHVWGLEGWLTGPYSVIVTLIMFTPMLANIFTRLITKEGFADSKLHFNLKGNFKFYLIAFFIPMIFGIIIALIVNITHGNWRFEALAELSFSEVFMAFMNMIVAPILYGFTCCFGEEFGWRAYLNQKLEGLTGTVGAVLIGGTIWGLWHALLVAKGYNFGSGHALLGITLMCVSCISLNAVLIWLTQKTNSVYPAAIMHAVLDIGMITFVSQLLISGVDDMTDKATALQVGILEMVIPECIVGTVFFILLLRDNKTKPSAETTER